VDYLKTTIAYVYVKKEDYRNDMKDLKTAISKLDQKIERLLSEK